MKRYEKILLILVAASILLRFIAPYFTSLFFLLGVWLLALSYLIAGYWLLKPKEEKTYFIPIAGGIAMALPLFVFPHVSYVNKEDVFYFFTIPLALLVTGLIGYWMKLRRRKEKPAPYIRHIFIRLLVIGVISSFFIYAPATWGIYRTILIAMNGQNPHVINNLRMIGYSIECEEALEKGDCEQAFDLAVKANEAGKSWLGIWEDTSQVKLSTEQIIHRLADRSTHEIEVGPDKKRSAAEIANEIANGSKQKISSGIGEALRQFMQEDTRQKIGRTYDNLYQVYKCRGDNKYEKGQFKDALADYEKGYLYLTTCKHDAPYWNEEISWSLNSIAQCYYQLKEYGKADTLFTGAIHNYKEVNDSSDAGLASLYNNFALSLSAGLDFDYSNDLYLRSNFIYKKDTSMESNRRSLVQNYYRLTGNYLKQDSLRLALACVKRALKYVRPTEYEYGVATVFYGACLFRLNQYEKADSVLKIALEFYNKEKDNNQDYIAECNQVLSQVNGQLARYEQAKTYIDAAIRIIENKAGVKSERYARYLSTLAWLNKVTGEYELAKKQYNAVAEIYSGTPDDNAYARAVVLGEQADLEVILSNFESAGEHASQSLALGASNRPLVYPSSAGLLNGAGYVYYTVGLYKASDTLYRKVLEINQRYDVYATAGTAAALNGLGLIETARKNFRKADSLFIASLELHTALFSERHPSTALVMLNRGILLTAEKKLEEAETLLNKALSIDRQFFKENHDLFADIYTAKGDLEKKKKQNDAAKVAYQKALTIYQKKFSPEHWRILSLKKKMGA